MKGTGCSTSSASTEKLQQRTLEIMSSKQLWLIFSFFPQIFIEMKHGVLMEPCNILHCNLREHLGNLMLFSPRHCIHPQDLSHTLLIGSWIKNFKKIELKLVCVGFRVFWGFFFFLFGWLVESYLIGFLVLWSFLFVSRLGFFVISLHIPLTLALYLCSTQVIIRASLNTYDLNVFYYYF